MQYFSDVNDNTLHKVLETPNNYEEIMSSGKKLKAEDTLFTSI